MRNFYFFVILLAVVIGLAMWVDAVKAAEGHAVGEPAAKWQIGIGDHVQVCLDVRSGEHVVRIEGTIESMDNGVVRLRDRISNVMNNGRENYVEDREVLRVVPWEHVVYLEKDLTSPTTRPAVN